MGATALPKIGELWLISGFYNNKFVAKRGAGSRPWCSEKFVELMGVRGTLKWTDLNGTEAVVIDINTMDPSGAYKVFYKGDRRAWLKIPPTYLVRRLGSVKLDMHAKAINTIVGPGRKCCSPMVGMCDNCKFEAHLGKVDKGFAWNYVTRSYDKKR